MWEVLVARSCVFFRSSDLPLSQALHHPVYVSGALIPTEKKLLIDRCCVSCPTLQIQIKGFGQSRFTLTDCASERETAPVTSVSS